MQPGDVVADRFEIERLAGAGGTGVVFAALDRQTGQRVALKMLHIASSEPQSDRFAREARVLAKLDHPGIVRLVAHGEADGARYLAMEWLDGEDLSAHLARGPMAVRDAIGLVARTAEALAAAHATGVIHRDVKPSNLYLVGGSPAHVKVLDFGVARLSEGGTSTRTGALIGTPGYMAPEQARGERNVGPRADVFSLGCVLFECLSGRPPFAGDNPMALLANLLLEEAPRLSDVATAPSPELTDLVARMLAKSPEARPADAQLVARELGALEAIVGGAARSTALTFAISGAERRVLTVLVVLGTSRIDELSEAHSHQTLPATGDYPSPTALDALARRYGARFTELTDGTTLVTLWGNGAATDQVGRAARLSLELRRLVPDGAIALATGRGVVRGGLPSGQVIDRAQGLLYALVGREEDERRSLSTPVRLDETTAGLLDRRFVVSRDDAGFQLGSERKGFAVARGLVAQPSPFVGRERELALLEGAQRMTEDEPAAHVVLVSAPPGGGKTRLAQELLKARIAAPEPPVIWIAEGDPTTAGQPFAMLARALGKKPTDDLSGSNELERAFLEKLGATLEERAVILLLEDLQWGDLPSIVAVDAALRDFADRPLFVIALARPEVHRVFPKLWDDRPLQEMRLSDLTRRSAERLCAQLAGVAGEELAAMVERAAGSAFAIEEIARAYAEKRGGGTPETVLAVAEARLAALDAEARRVLRAASVFGPTFQRKGVAALLGDIDEKMLVVWLGELGRTEMIEARGEDLAFRHALLREAAYAMMTDADRELGHRLAAAWLEGATPPDHATIASHYERGASGEAAARNYALAANAARAAGQEELGRSYAARALDCGAEDPELVTWVESGPPD